MSETNYNECADAIVYGSPVVDEIDKNGGVQINFVPIYQGNFGMSLNLERDVFNTYKLSLLGDIRGKSNIETIATFLEHDVCHGKKITRMVFLKGAKAEGPIVEGKGPANCITCVIFLEKDVATCPGNYFPISDIAEFVVEGRAYWEDYEIIDDANSFIKSPKFSANKKLWEVVFAASPDKE